MLLLVTLQDLGYEDVARITGVPVGTVMSRLSRARSRLRELMEGAAARARRAAVPLRAPEMKRMPMNDDTDRRTTRPSCTPAWTGGWTRRARSGAGRAWRATRTPRGARARLDRPSARRCAACTRQVLRRAGAAARWLQARAAPASRAAAALASWQRWGGLAASAADRVRLGWVSHQQWQAPERASAWRRRAALAEFGRQAVLAHAVYTPEVRHPVEVRGGAAGAPGAVAVQAAGPAAEGARPARRRATNWWAAACCPATRARGRSSCTRTRGRRAHHALRRRGRPAPAARAAAAPARPPSASPAQDGASSFYWVDQGFGYAGAARGRLLAPAAVTAAAARWSDRRVLASQAG